MKIKMLCGLLLGLISSAAMAQDAIRANGFAPASVQQPVSALSTASIDPAIRSHYGTESDPDYRGDALLKTISDRVEASLNASLQRTLEPEHPVEVMPEALEVGTY